MRNAPRAAGAREEINDPIMNLSQGYSHRRSCWGVARTAFAVFLVAVAVVYLFGGFEQAVMRVG